MGSVDESLNEKGREQISQLRSVLNAIAPKSVVVSPKKRCMESAEILLEDKDIQPVVVSELQSRARGSWEGKSWREIEDIRKENNLSLRDVPDDAEQWDDFMQRVCSGIDVALEQDTPTVIIGHTSTGYALCHYFNLPSTQLPAGKVFCFSRNGIQTLPP